MRFPKHGPSSGTKSGNHVATHMHILLCIIAIVSVLGGNNSFAQGTLAPVAQQVFLDNSGNPINAGKLCTYAAGTTNPQPTYYNQDLDVSHQNSNPVILNGAGRPTTGGVYFSATSYNIVLLTAGTDTTCSTGTTIYSQDNVSAVPSTSLALDVSGVAGEALAAGDVAYLSDGSGALTNGRWYKADADFTYASSSAAMLGLVPTAIASGATGSIRIGGRVTGLSALTAGSTYYASATAGALTATAPTNTRFIGQADTTTSLVIAPNPARNPVALSLAEGRLTASTVTPVTTADVSGVTSIFYTPYKGNRIALFDGTAVWNIRLFSEITISLVGLTASRPYDLFAYDNAGVVTIETLVWTNATTRATALALQNGVLVKSGVTTRRYLGTVFINSSGGQTDDTAAKRYIYNYYNRVPRVLRRNDTGTWNYTTATIRQANGNAANQVEVMEGVNEDAVDLALAVPLRNTNAGVLVAVGIGLDSTTAGSGNAVGGETGSVTANVETSAYSRYVGFVGVGWHKLVWLEFSTATGTTTWESSNNFSAGLVGISWQ